MRSRVFLDSVAVLARKPRAVFLATIAMVFSGCCIHVPAKCSTRPHAVANKLNLIATHQIQTASFTFGANHRPVYIAEAPIGVAHPAPVLLLHEMPALSLGTLELAQRIAVHGYRVYIPLLFGRFEDDSESSLVFFRRSLGLLLDPSWKSAYRNDEHLGVLDQLQTLCSEEILPKHPKKRLGVIGMCISGSVALGLAAHIREVVAPVVSQPTIPLVACTKKSREALGLTAAEMKTLKLRSQHRLQILGFRFEGDRVCPKERFDHLNATFGHKAFVDRTLLGARYHCIDHLPYRVHPVLTNCYLNSEPGKPESATHYAFRELLAFLDAKLKHSIMQPYFDPPAKIATTLTTKSH